MRLQGPPPVPQGGAGPGRAPGRGALGSAHTARRTIEFYERSSFRGYNSMGPIPRALFNNSAPLGGGGGRWWWWGGPSQKKYWAKFSSGPRPIKNFLWPGANWFRPKIFFGVSKTSAPPEGGGGGGVVGVGGLDPPL